MPDETEKKYAPEVQQMVADLASLMEDLGVAQDLADRIIILAADRMEQACWAIAALRRQLTEPVAYLTLAYREAMERVNVLQSQHNHQTRLIQSMSAGHERVRASVDRKVEALRDLLAVAEREGELPESLRERIAQELARE